MDELRVDLLHNGITTSVFFKRLPSPNLEKSKFSLGWGSFSFGTGKFSLGWNLKTHWTTTSGGRVLTDTVRYFTHIVSLQYFTRLYP